MIAVTGTCNIAINVFTYNIVNKRYVITAYMFKSQSTTYMFEQIYTDNTTTIIEFKVQFVQLATTTQCY